MNSAAKNEGTLPLSGITVVEFCQIAAGPFCGMTLADLGAEVIKVEPPNGDAMRTWPPLTDGYSENFASLNRNKKSIALDLKESDDLQIALRLCRSADVVLENNRPGVMARLGLGFETLCRDIPSLIYCSISAYGQTGPRAEEGAFDVTMQAISGIMSVTGEQGESPVKCGVPLSDFSTGLYAAFHIAAALYTRNQTGKGTHIDCSMLGASLGIAPLQVSEYFGTGADPQRIGSRHPRNAPYQAYKASDDYFVLAAGNQRLFEIVCHIIKRPDLLRDERFQSTLLRARNQQELEGILTKIFVSETADYWISKFAKAGVPTSPINKYSAALKDPQVVAQNWVQELELPDAASTKTFAHPIRLNGELPRVQSRPPRLNEHREEILLRIRHAK